MSDVIIEKYAHVLTAEDVMRLFKHLEDTLGSRVKAADICRIERKTIYDWEKTGEVKLKTKRKVLKALMEKLPEDTLDFMTKRSVESSIDILRIYLYSLYETAVDEGTSMDDFRRLASKFEEAKTKYSGLTVDHLDVEIGDMLRSLEEKASEMELMWPRSPIDLVRLSKLSEILPATIKALSSKPLITDFQIAKDFGFTLEFVQSLSMALQESFVAIRPSAPRIEQVYPAYEPLTAGTIPAREPSSTPWVTQEQILTMSRR